MQDEVERRVNIRLARLRRSRASPTIDDHVSSVPA